MAYTCVCGWLVSLFTRSGALHLQCDRRDETLQVLLRLGAMIRAYHQDGTAHDMLVSAIARSGVVARKPMQDGFGDVSLVCVLKGGGWHSCRFRFGMLCARSPLRLRC